MYKKLSGSIAALLIVLCAYSGVVYGEELQKGTITANSVNFRQSPGTSAKILTRMNKGTSVSVVSVGESWTKIRYKNLTGWVHNDYIKISTLGTGTVSVRVLNVRSSAGLSAKVITKLKKGEKVTVILKSGEWYKVKTSNGKTGWAFGEYIKLTSTSTSRGGADREESAAAVSLMSSGRAGDRTDLRQQVVEYAGRFMDSPYVYGGESPKGFDCSGFTSYVFSHFGIALDRTAAEQSQQGTAIAKSELLPGDLIFFATGGGRINHVGIYTGNGRFIHAESRREGVTITGLSEGYYVRSYVKSKRIIE